MSELGIIFAILVTPFALTSLSLVETTRQQRMVAGVWAWLLLFAAIACGSAGIWVG